MTDDPRNSDTGIPVIRNTRGTSADVKESLEADDVEGNLDADDLVFDVDNEPEAEIETPEVETPEVETRQEDETPEPEVIHATATPVGSTWSIGKFLGHPAAIPLSAAIGAYADQIPQFLGDVAHGINSFDTNIPVAPRLVTAVAFGFAHWMAIKSSNVQTPAASTNFNLPARKTIGGAAGAIAGTALGVFTPLPLGLAIGSGIGGGVWAAAKTKPNSLREYFNGKMLKEFAIKSAMCGAFLFGADKMTRDGDKVEKKNGEKPAAAAVEEVKISNEDALKLFNEKWDASEQPRDNSNTNGGTSAPTPPALDF